MTEQDRAAQRLHDASKRLAQANEEVDAAHRELVEAALALDRVEGVCGEEQLR